MSVGVSARRRKALWMVVWLDGIGEPAKERFRERLCRGGLWRMAERWLVMRSMVREG